MAYDATSTDVGAGSVVAAAYSPTFAPNVDATKNLIGRGEKASYPGNPITL